MSTSGIQVGTGDLPLSELVELTLEDSLFYAHTFFPNTVRQPPALFHPEIWRLLELPYQRYVNIQVMRDGAKTTLLRLFASKRIAFSLSRTILYIGKSEGHAIRSLQWLQRQVEYNPRWAQTFGLRKGNKWGGPEIEIFHGVDEAPIWILAMGITGSVRGINRDDFRPDLIIVDDVVDEENAATPEGRKKVHDLIHGAIKDSLAPESESPDAKLVMLQTPLDEDDPSTAALKDPSWLSARFPCWTLETEGLPIAQQKSSWPARYSDETLRKEKRAAILSGRYYIFAREKELRLTSPETSAFHSYRLNFYELTPPREEMKVIMWIDPVPPPTEHQVAKGFARKDFEAMAIVGMWQDRFYLLEVQASRGHQPDWTENTFFELAARWRPREIWIEAIAYQVTLAYSLRKAMHERRRFYAIHEDQDRRKKYDKIVDGLSGPAKAGQLYVKESDTTFIEQFEKYPNVSHDDVIEAVARAVEKLNFDNVIEGEYEEIEEDEKAYPALEDWRAAP